MIFRLLSFTQTPTPFLNKKFNSLFFAVSCKILSAVTTSSDDSQVSSPIEITQTESCLKTKCALLI